MRKLLATFMLIGILILSPAVGYGDPVPPDRRIDWTFAGVPGGIPDRTRICAELIPGVSVSKINTAIRLCSASGGGIVYLSPGLYEVEGIELHWDNVSLRGAGADQTILKGCNIINLGKGGNMPSKTTIIGGGTKGAFTIEVSSTLGLAANRMIEIDRDDDPDVVVTTTGGSRHIRQVNMITALRGRTITLKNPLIWDFSVGNPRIRWTFQNTRWSGVENLKLDHSGKTGCTHFLLQYCYACWLKGIHSHKASSYHFVIVGTLNGEVRDSYIADAQTYGPNNGGLVFYANPKYGSNSSWKIENNIFDKVFPGVQLQNGSSGFYVGYNYGHAATANLTEGPVTWMFTDNHGPHDMMNLWEGNIGELFGSDGYFGGSSHGTLLRNHFTGYNPLFRSNGDPIRLNRFSYFYNLVGNVLGSADQAPLNYQQTLNNCAPGVAIYRLGYPNIGNCGLEDITGQQAPVGMKYPDAKVEATLLRWGNYDYFTKVARFIRSELPAEAVVASHKIPNSYYYSNKPGWWPADIQWPPIGPDVTAGNGDPSGHVHRIPAQVCWSARKLADGGNFNASSCHAHRD